MSSSRESKNKSFAKNLGFDLESEIGGTLFHDDRAIGFSFRRKYDTSKTKFIPAKNKKDEDDSLILIRIGYYDKNPQLCDEKGRSLLVITIAKVSDFELSYDYQVPDSKLNSKEAPTKNSLVISRESWQPIDLEDKLYFDEKENKLYEKNSDKEVNAKERIEYLLKQHQSPSLSFRTKVYSHLISNKLYIFWHFNCLPYIEHYINYLNKYWFSIEKIQQNELNKNSFSGTTNILLSTIKDDSKIFGINLRVEGSFVGFLSFILCLHLFFLNESLLYLLLKTFIPTNFEKNSWVIVPITITCIYVLSLIIKWNFKNLLMNNDKDGVKKSELIPFNSKNKYFYFHLIIFVLLTLIFFGLFIPLLNMISSMFENFNYYLHILLQLTLQSISKICLYIQ